MKAKTCAHGNNTQAKITNDQALTLDNSDKMAAVFDTESVEGPYYLEKVSIPEDSEDGFEYEEISVEEESVSEEEDLETAAEVLCNRAKKSELVPERILSPPRKLQSPVPEVVDDFLRNFLVKTGMNKTLDCFQKEWFEMLHKGTLKTHQVGLVPDIYTHIQLLDNELKNVQRERDSYKQAAFQAGEAIVTLQKERDFHRLQHKRVVQEKNRLIEDIRRLKKHYESYAPALKQLNEKYQTALRQKMLVSIERDRVSSQVQNLDSALCNSRSSPGTRRFLKENEVYNGRSPERATKPSVDEVMTYDLAKDPTKNATTKHLKDSEFPASTRINPFLPQIKALSAQSTKISGFSVNNSIKAHTMAVSYLALHPRKLLVASASDDHLWRLWGMPEGEMIMTGEGHTDWLSSCSFHPSGHCLATTSGDTTVRIWDFAKSRCVLTLEGHTHATWGCSFHSCGDFVASCSMDNTGKVWDLNSERCRYTLRGHIDSVNSICFVPFSNILLTCSADKTISLWDARAGLCAQTFYGHRHSCNSATFNALGDMIASCDSYGIVKLWDVLAVASNDHESVIFDHKGEYLLSAGYDEAMKSVGMRRKREAPASRIDRRKTHMNAIEQMLEDSDEGSYCSTTTSDGSGSEYRESDDAPGSSDDDSDDSPAPKRADARDDSGGTDDEKCGGTDDEKWGRGFAPTAEEVSQRKHPGRRRYERLFGQRRETGKEKEGEAEAREAAAKRKERKKKLMELLKKRKSGTPLRRRRTLESEEVEVAENEPEDKGAVQTSDDESSKEDSIRLIDSSEEEKQADTDSLKDFIVEDEERKEGEGEEEVAETDKKNFRSHLPREFITGSHFAHFQLVVKALLINALDSSFLKSLYDGERTKRYAEEMKLSLRHFDERLVLPRLENLKQRSRWKDRYKERVECYPKVRVRMVNIRTKGCEACELHRNGRFCVRLSGQLYHNHTLQEDQFMPDDAQTFFVGSVCASRTEVYHALKHFKYHLFERCRTALENQKEAEQQTQEGDEDKPVKETVNKVFNKLLEEGWITEQYDEFEERLNAADFFQEEKLD
ncbi:hypothetical protein QTP70_002473 [Hemibagrus guttatus]|uniref:DUF4211 domain-containing protein n=1 Tax=Hemibagrus guttatus TaxID=175788 RepID=A0AAE0UYA4_9TELE|nr:hypothetical protein QTP70_002473 [Hemibagrus guttatus]